MSENPKGTSKIIHRPCAWFNIPHRDPVLTLMRLATLILLVLAICHPACAEGETRRIPVILDTDIGDSIDDALALALKFQVPIYVADDVLETAGKRADFAVGDERREETEREFEKTEDVRAWLENLRPEDFADPQ